MRALDDGSGATVAAHCIDGDPDHGPSGAVGAAVFRPRAPALPAALAAITYGAWTRSGSTSRPL